MGINQVQFLQVVEAAKVKAANSPRWLRAIDRAAEGILSGELIVTVLMDGAQVTSPNGSYLANGSCGCKAFQYGHKECRHRAAARLMERYEEMEAARAASKLGVFVRVYAFVARLTQWMFRFVREART